MLPIDRNIRDKICLGWGANIGLSPFESSAVVLSVLPSRKDSKEANNGGFVENVDSTYFIACSTGISPSLAAAQNACTRFWRSSFP